MTLENVADRKLDYALTALTFLSLTSLTLRAGRCTCRARVAPSAAAAILLTVQVVREPAVRQFVQLFHQASYKAARSAPLSVRFD